uniref:cytochrome b6-f complex subunit petP n=1 Tax=Hypnea cervicornis TaxID=387623 RepID=UPI0021B64F31|nr:cytochrome b6-f complex subunit petP [Hypnea cervicornis]UVW80708.1 cytochrome b6-f complex subunit petP [Hypnea cervicornis]
MNIKINETVKITKLKNNKNSKLAKFFYKTGTIIGTKKIKNKILVFIIELKDYSRIWMLKKEITTLSRYN